MSIIKYIICSLALGTLFSGELVKSFKFLKKKFSKSKKFKYYITGGRTMLFKLNGKQKYYTLNDGIWEFTWSSVDSIQNFTKIKRSEARKLFPKAFRKNS